MKIIWAKSGQHTDWGLFKVGDVIDTEAVPTNRGTGILGIIPEAIVQAWIADGYAILEAPADAPKPEKPEKPKKNRKTI